MTPRTLSAGAAIALVLVAGTAATPVLAQQGDGAAASPQPAHDARDEQLSAMRAELAALKEQVAQLEQRLANASAPASSSPERNASPAPAVADAGGADAAAPVGKAVEAAPAIAFKGAPEITATGGWSFKPRGRLQFDGGVISAPGSVPALEGFGSIVRRARLGVEGTMPGNLGYRFDVEFPRGEAELFDAYLTYSRDGLVLTVGQHNNFQSLEELTSSLFLSQLERAAFTDAFGFERRLGVSVQYGKDAWLVQSGLFTDNAASLPDKNWSTDTRVVFAPKLDGWQAHLGGSIHYSDLAIGTPLRDRERPLVNFTDVRPIDTRAIDASSELGRGLELALQRGPLHLAGEAFWQSVERPGPVADPTFFGAYAEIGLFLTRGDARGYKAGRFDRIRPERPVTDGGPGAWQINLRYDHLDLSDSGIVGGQQDAVLGSLIFTPTDYTRLMLNLGFIDYADAVVRTEAGEPIDSARFAAMRAQIDF